MVWYRVMLLVFAWLFIRVSERIFPRFQPPLQMDEYSDLWTVLLFRPLHLLFSVLCFIGAFLLIRHVTVQHIRMIIRKKNRMESIALVLLGWWMVAVTLMENLLPTATLLGVLALYDLIQWLFSTRRNKRLKAAFRQLR